MLSLSSASCVRQRDPSQIQLWNRLACHCSHIVLLESTDQKPSMFRELKMPDTYSQEEQPIASSKKLGLCLDEMPLNTHFGIHPRRTTRHYVQRCQARKLRRPGKIDWSWMLCPARSVFAAPSAIYDYNAIFYNSHLKRFRQATSNGRSMRPMVS